MKNDVQDGLLKQLKATVGRADNLSYADEEIEGILIAKEEQFGGFVMCPREKVSKHDTRSKEELALLPHHGGDRMSVHGYAPKYAEYLKKYLDRKTPLIIAEVGILMGTGLAIWCDIFPNARVLGFDINLENINNNMKNLKELGAFKENSPELYEFDQFDDNTFYLQKILKNNKIDIFIDDGVHSVETIMQTLYSALPHLADDFVYFIEDNSDVHQEIREKHPELSVESWGGELTVLHRNQEVRNNIMQNNKYALSIVFFSHSAELNGAERSLFDLTSKLVKRGVICSVILPSKGPLGKLMRLHGVATIVIPSSGCFWAKFPGECSDSNDTRFFYIDNIINKNIIPVIEKINPDIIYSQTIINPVGAVVAKKMNLPHIVSAREYGFLDHKLEFIFGIEESVRALYEDSDILFSVTDDVKNVLFNKFDLKKVITVYSSITLDEGKLRQFDRNNKRIDKKSVTKISILGSLQEGKGQMDAVKAAEILLKKGYNIELFLVGNAGEAYLEKINNYILDHCMQDNITIGKFSENNLKLLNDSDILLSCARCEALGRTMLEAALMKRPFIYANSGGPKEVFIDGKHALGYEPGDIDDLANKIAEAINNPDETYKRVDSAYEYVKNNINDTNYVDRQLDAITELLKNRKPQRGTNTSSCLNLIKENLNYKELAEYFASKEELSNLELTFYMAEEGELFSEKNNFKIKANSTTPGIFSFKVPDEFSQFNHVRIDFGDEPLMFLLHDICVLNKNRFPVWTWQGDATEFAFTSGITFLRSNSYSLVFCTDNDPQFVLPEICSNDGMSEINIFISSVGADGVSGIVLDAKKSLQMKIQKLENDIRIKDIEGIADYSIFYDTGNGFNEVEKINGNGGSRVADNIYRIKCELPQNVRSIRFDPCEGKACIIKNLEIITNHGSMNDYSHNGISIDNFIIFSDTDPQITINLNCPPSFICINVEIFVYDTDNFVFLDRIKDYVQKNNVYENKLQETKKYFSCLEFISTDIKDFSQSSEYDEEKLKRILLFIGERFEVLNTNIENKDKLIVEHENELLVLKQQNAVYNDENLSKDRLIVEHENELLLLQTQITRLNEENAEKNSQINGLNNQLRNTAAHLVNSQNSFNAIINSTSWKVTKPIRLILDSIKKIMKSNRVTHMSYKALVNLKNNGIKDTLKKIKIKLGSVKRTVKQSTGLTKVASAKIVSKCYKPEDFVINGIKYFDMEYYYSKYPDVKNAGLDGLQHYLRDGWRERRAPSDNFDVAFYTSEYADLNMCPLLHFVQYGRHEGRFANIVEKKANSYEKKIEYIRRKLNIVPHFHDQYTEINLNDDIKSKKIAVHLHLYYLEMSDYFIEKLNNIGIDFTLFISIVDEQKVSEIKTYFKNNIKNVQKIEVEVVENRGRDIAPLIVTFGRKLLDYDYICHIHTKKSPHYQHGGSWCHDIVNTLLGSRSIFNQNLNLLNKDGRIIFNEPNINIYACNFGWGANFDVTAEFLKKYSEFNIKDYPSIDFPQGSMFWARSEAIKDFLMLPLKITDFPKEPIEPDGTIAHALERMMLIFVSKYHGKSYCLYSKNDPAGFGYYEDKIDFSKFEIKNKNLKVLSYYLPQFDTNPINDRCHGKGFTEWTKVCAANPLFYGHYQQHVPHEDVGYYKLNTPDVLEKQATMMHDFGVYGQIFYHYWFDGQLILEKPAQILLANKHINMPFCFCWANENWTKKWDGNDAETILEQKYSPEDAKAFIRYLIPFFKDDRYIKVDNRPVLFVYRVASIPNFKEYFDIWANECIGAGLNAPYLVATLIREVNSPIPYGMDAGVERAPYDWSDVANARITGEVQTFDEPKCNIFNYDQIIEHYEGIEYTDDYPVFRSAFPIWDNTARYGDNAYIVHNSTPIKFQKWIHNLIDYTVRKLPSDEQFLIVNAWNEWAEAAHLEPDKKYGYAYLNSVGREVYNTKPSDLCSIHNFYSDNKNNDNIRINIYFADNAIQEILNNGYSKLFIDMLGKSSIFEKYYVGISNKIVFDLLGNSNAIYCESNAICDYIIYFEKLVGVSPNDIEHILRMAVENPSAVINAFTYLYSMNVDRNEMLSISEEEASKSAIKARKASNIKKTNKVTCNTFLFAIDDPRLTKDLDKIIEVSLNKNIYLIFDHSLGGGTESYIDQNIKELRENNIVLRVQYFYQTDQMHYLVTLYETDSDFNMIFYDLSILIYLNSIIRIVEIFVNSLVCYRDINATLNLIAELKDDKKKIVYALHDYYSICPSYNLLNCNTEYCGNGYSNDKKSCNDCYKILKSTNAVFDLITKISVSVSIHQWQSIWSNFLVDICDRVIVFSSSSKQILEKAYPMIEGNVELIPHKVLPLREVKITKHPTINIGIIGHINFHKGAEIVAEMNDILLSASSNEAKIIVVGDFEGDNNRVVRIGQYKRDELPSILEKYDIDIVFISSIWPETFSYTTSEAILMNIPVASFDIGAPAERISKYQNGLVISHINPKIALSEIIDYVQKLRKDK